jgi:hypothetical protein
MSMDAIAVGAGGIFAESGVEGSLSEIGGGVQWAVEVSRNRVPETNTALALTAKKDWRNLFSDTGIASLVATRY